MRSFPDGETFDRRIYLTNVCRARAGPDISRLDRAGTLYHLRRDAAVPQTLRETYGDASKIPIPRVSPPAIFRSPEWGLKKRAQGNSPNGAYGRQPRVKPWAIEPPHWYFPERGYRERLCSFSRRDKEELEGVRHRCADRFFPEGSAGTESASEPQAEVASIFDGVELVAH